MSETMTGQSVKGKVLEIAYPELHRCVFCNSYGEEMCKGELCDTCREDMGVVGEFNERKRLIDLTEKLVRKECDNNCKAKCIYLSEEVAKAENKLSGIREGVEAFENPYPKDVFRWDNKEKLDFDRGRFNRHCFETVENVRKEMLKIIGKEK